MSENNKEDISHFGIKIENMLDELIKSDDELDNNQMRNSLKFSEDNSLSEEEKENAGELFNTDIFSNIFSPIEEQNTNPNQNNQSNKNKSNTSIHKINSEMCTFPKYNESTNYESI